MTQSSTPSGAFPARSLAVDWPRSQVAKVLTGSGSPPRLVISAELLGSPDPRIADLLRTHNGGQPLVVRQAVLADPGAGDDPAAALLTGRTNFRNVDDAPVTVRLRPVPDGVELRIRIALPATWKFSQSFPQLPTSIDFRAPLQSAPSPLLDLLTIEAGAFLLSTHGHQDEVLGAALPAGLGFVARLRLVGLFGAIEQTLGGTRPLVIAGPIVPGPPVPSAVPPEAAPSVSIPSPTPLPGINLRAGLDVEAKVGPLSLRRVCLQLYCPPDRDWLARHPQQPPAAFFGGSLAIGSGNALQVWARVPPGGGHSVVLTAEPDGGDGHGAIDLADLADLTGGADLTAQLTPQLGELGELSLRRITATVSLSPASLDQVSLTVGLGEVRWTPLPGVLEITDLAAVFTLISPLARGRSLDVALLGTLAIEDALITIVVTLPDWTIVTDVHTQATLSLAGLMRRYLSDVPPIGDLTVNRVMLTARPGQFCSVAAVLAEQPPWTLDLGPQRLTIRDVELSLNYAAGTGFGGVFSGRLALAGVELDLGYQVPGPFVLRADLPRIGLRALLEALSDQQIPWPSGFDLELASSRIRIESRGADLALVLGTQLEGFGSLAVEARRNAGRWGFAAGFALPTGWRFAQLSPALAGLDEAFRFERVVLVVASFDDPGFAFPDLSPFGDPAITSPRVSLPSSAPGVTAGVSLFAAMALDGDRGLELLRDSLHLDHAELDVLVQIGRDPASALLSAAVSGSFNDNLKFTGALRVRLAGGVPAIGLLGQVAMQANGRPMVFTVQLDVGPNGALLAGTMAGVWKGAFGVPELTLADLALALGISWELVPALGIAATFSLGGFAGSAALLFDSIAPERSLLAGSMSDLSLSDVLRMLTDEQAEPAAELAGVLDGIRLEGVPLFVLPAALADDLDGGSVTAEVVAAFARAGRIQLPTAPTGSMLTVTERERRWHLTDRTSLRHYGISRQEDGLMVSRAVQLYIVPKPTMIGQLSFPQGIRLAAALSVFGLGGSVDVDVDPSAGIRVDGSVRPIQAGPVFALTGDGEDGGPLISLATYDAPAARIRGPHCVVSGSVTMLGFTRDIDLRISRDGFSLSVSASLFDAFEATVTASLPLRDFNASDLTVTADMHHNFLTLLRTRGQAAIREAAADATRTIADARAQVNVEQTRLRGFQSQLDAQIAQVRKERSGADRALKDAQRQVDTIQAQINAEWRAINHLKAEIDRLRSSGNLFNGWNLDKITAKGFEIAGHEITLGGVQASLATATGSLNIARAAVTNIPVEADPRVSWLITQLGTAQGMLLGAEQALAQIQAALGGLAVAGDWIARNGPDHLLDVPAASFTGRLGVVSGGAVSLHVTYTLMGVPGTLDFGLDFHDVERGIDALVDLLKNQIRAGIPQG